MPEELNPQTGGSWTRDPMTGELSPNVPAAEPAVPQLNPAAVVVEAPATTEKE